MRNPLLYDLEPRNFLRIEGAIGQDYRTAVETIRQQIDAYRLPIDVVALRTGALVTGLDIENYDVHFADLQSQYAVLRESILGRFAEVLVRFYDTKILDQQGNPTGTGFAGVPQAPLLRRLVGYQYLRGTVGAFYEDHYAQHTASGPFTVGLDLAYYLHLSIIHALVPVESRFAAELWDLDYPAIQNSFGLFQGGSRFLSRLVASTLNDAQTGGAATNARVDLEEYSDQLDELVTSGDLAALAALYAQYEQRRETLLERQLFATFQREHPGLQFKAGTTLGGTFVLVYHGLDGYTKPPRRGSFRLFGRVSNQGKPVPGARVSVVDRYRVASTRSDGQFNLTVNDLPLQLSIHVPGAQARTVAVQDEGQFLELDVSNITAPPINLPVPGLTEGTVIADFYLPYRCCGGGLPIQVYPPQPPQVPTEPLTASVSQVGCSRMMRNLLVGDVEFTASGGTPPYFLEDQNGNRQDLPEGPQEIFGGFSGKVTDSGSGSVPLVITLRDALTVTLLGTPQCSADNQRYAQEFQVTGGLPPYSYLQPDGTQVTIPAGGTGSVKEIPSGDAFTLVVTDDSEVNCSQQIGIGPHTCVVGGRECGFPCNGIATRASYPLWLQRPNTEVTEYRELSFVLDQLSLTDETGNTFSLTVNDLGPVNTDIADLLAEQNSTLTAGNFQELTKRILERLARAADDGINVRLALPDSEPGLLLSFAEAESFDRFTARLFDCYIWEMGVTVNYREGIQGRDASLPRQRRVTYSSEGAAFQARILLDNQSSESSASAATFDRIRIDRCNPDAPEVALCTAELPDSAIRVEGQGRGRQLSIDGNSANLKPFWDLTFGIPAVSDQSSFGAGFLIGDLNAGVALLLVDPVTGCYRVDRTNVGT